ncbi:CHAP domain-containing protein, partial [Enterococcus faecium]
DNTYGHVAFVEKVFKDGSILISEMNVKGLNVVSTRTISADETHLMNYIVPKDK